MRVFSSLLCVCLFLGSTFSVVQAQTTSVLSSPNAHIKLYVISEKGTIKYLIQYKNKTVIDSSLLGFDAKKTYGYTTKEELPFLDYWELVSVDTSVYDKQWSPILGELKTIRNHYHEATLTLRTKDTKGYIMKLIFRLFDDGVGFRYVFPEQKGLDYFTITKEHTQFALRQDYTAWWQAGSYNTNEYTLHESLLHDIDALQECGSNELFAPLGCTENLVQTPLTLKSTEGKLYLNIHEAALIHFPAMQLLLDKKTNTFTADLVPDAFGNKAYVQTPFATPWRTVLISDKATDLIASKIILNLNDSCTYKDVSFIKPVKYVGVWWEMFVGKGTWDYAGTQQSDQKENPAGGVHSARTQNVKKYIDFASKYGFDGVLVEGWNTGWEDWFGKWKENVFDFVTPYPDFDIKGLSDYAHSKGVYLIMHHETSGSATNYERWMDTAYQLMNLYRYPAVKTGYVGPIIPRGEHHDGQWMIDHYIRVAKKAAAYRIMIDVHEPVRPTGLQRTYPNWISSEAARGMEYNAWGKGNAIDHDLNLIFTRLIGGPMDYTPGIFKLKLDYFPNKKEVVHSTLTRQLALYVVLYSPLQMAADLPENYEAKPDAFEFIHKVATDWDDTKILEAEPGEYITTARKAKHTQEWFLGSITDEKPRQTSIRLDFLDKDKTYEATIYEDVVGVTKVDINPEAYRIRTIKVRQNDTLKLSLVGAGGTAVSFIPLP